MLITIELKCPHCHNTSIERNGRKGNGSQNYLCKTCKKQFVGDREKKYRGSLSWTAALIKSMFVRGSGVRDISAVLRVSVKKVLKTLKSTKYRIQPRRKHYDRLETDVGGQGCQAPR